MEYSIRPSHYFEWDCNRKIWNLRDDFGRILGSYTNYADTVNKYYNDMGLELAA